MDAYEHTKIEKKWQERWEKDKAARATTGSARPKYYLLIEFPYPSGEGMHVGHLRSYTALDILARKRRGEGFEVLYPIGWDAFGLPTENYAIKTGIHPRIVTRQNTDNFRRQLKAAGFSFDWDREINTTDPEYYKWTQWIFLKLFKEGLAYKAKMPINWCLTCKIGLANEEVIDGACERCDGPTEKREKEQWMLAITKYADRLDKDLDTVDYLERIKVQQRNWIGRSEGAEIDFSVNGEILTVFTTRPDTLFGATYVVLAPDHKLLSTLKSKIENWDEVQAYAKASAAKTEMERTAEGRSKTGVRIRGINATNPATNEQIPIFVADYVLVSYGTGAIMAVPAHDERDYAFAQQFGMPVKHVLEPMFFQSTEPGKVRPELPFVPRDAVIAIVKHWSEEKYIGLKWKKVAWQTFVTGGIEKGQTAEEAARAEVYEETGFKNLTFVKDFGVAHGRFYHVPKAENRLIHGHILYFELSDDVRDEISEEEKENHDVQWISRDELDSYLTPDSHKYAWSLLNGTASSYTGEGVLINSGQFTGLETREAKKKITEAVGGRMTVSFKLRDWVFSRQRYWGEPIPMIQCGNCGYVPVPESDLPVRLPEVAEYKPTDSGESPLAAMTEWISTRCPSCGGVAKRETDTMPNWAGSSWYFLRYADPHNAETFASKEALQYWMPVDWYNGGMEHTTLHLLYSRFWHKFLFDQGLVLTSEPYRKRTSHGLILAEGGEKMSKSKGNIVNPDELIAIVGADALRVYEMFMGPFDQAIAWNSDSVAGSRRFIERFWRLSEKANAAPQTSSDLHLQSLMHQSIKKVSADIEAMKFNTAVSQLMIFLNELERTALGRKEFEIFLRLVAPFAPHVTEEIWQRLGYADSIHAAPWPTFDETKIMAGGGTIVVQVNGKNRGVLAGLEKASAEELETAALALPSVSKWLIGKEVKRVIHVPGRLINIVA